MKQDIIYILPRLYNSRGNFSKEWYIEFYCADQNGVLKRYKKCEGFKDCKTLEEKYAHANNLLAKYEQLLKSGWTPPVKRVVYKDHLQYKHFHKKPLEACLTIDFWMNKYLENKSKFLRDKSLSTYTSKLRKFNAWIIANKYDKLGLLNFSNKHALQFMDYIKESTQSSKTYNSYRQTCHSMWNWIIDEMENVMLINPWTKIKVMRSSGTRIKTFPPEIRKTVFEYLLEKDKIMWLVSQLVFQSFIRPGREISGLKIKDIDFTENKIWVRADISKNKKTQSVPLPLTVRKMMIELNYHCSDPEFYAFSFDGPSKYKVGRDYWSKRFSKYYQSLGTNNNLTLYSLKHTGNQIAHAKGMPLKKQMELNRHHSLDQTNIYLRGMEIENTEELSQYFD